MRLVEICDEAGIFFDRPDWENGSAYEAMDEMKSIIPKSKRKFDRDLRCWFIELSGYRGPEILQRLHQLVKKYDQTNVNTAEWDWDMQEIRKAKKKTDIYKWLYKTRPRVVITYPKMRGINKRFERPRELEIII